MKTKTVSTRLPESVVQRLTREAENTRRSLADILRDAAIRLLADMDEGERLTALEARLAAKIDAVNRKLDELAVEEVAS